MPYPTRFRSSLLACLLGLVALLLLRFRLFGLLALLVALVLLHGLVLAALRVLLPCELPLLACLFGLPVYLIALHALCLRLLGLATLVLLVPRLRAVLGLLPGGVREAWGCARTGWVCEGRRVRGLAGGLT